jgi:hypothetical protein
MFCAELMLRVEAKALGLLEWLWRITLNSIFIHIS